MTCKTVYLSGPIVGKTYADARYGWRAEVEDELAPDIRVLSPMRQEEHCATIKGKITLANTPENVFSSYRMIVQKDIFDIRNCDVMLVYLLGAKKVSIGTMVELGMAVMLNKPIIVVMKEDDPVHGHPFVSENAMLVTDDLNTAIKVIQGILSTGV